MTATVDERNDTGEEAELVEGDRRRDRQEEEGERRGERADGIAGRAPGTTPITMATAATTATTTAGGTRRTGTPLPATPSASTASDDVTGPTASSGLARSAGRYPRPPPRGCSSTARAPAFQAGGAGSIPVTRSAKPS